MPRITKPGNKTAAKCADQQFYSRHPDRKSKPLTSSSTDAQLRAEWIEAYNRCGGKTVPRVPSGARKTTLAACMKGPRKLAEVYVYIVEMAGGDPYGHVGLIVQQSDGSYVRYSQAL